MKSRRWIVKPKAKTLGPKDVVALYLAEFEKRFCRPVKHAVRKDVERNVTLFAQREGVEVAKKAVMAAFNLPRLRWIDAGAVDRFLVDRVLFARHVEPYLDDVLPIRGEQAEWTGDRSEEPGSERLW